MSTASEEILKRQEERNRIEREADTFGRQIGVKRLRPSQQMRLQEMSPGLEGTTPQIEASTGKEHDVPRRAPLFIAASVVEIDGAAVPFAKTRAELDSILDRLDEEGLAAAAVAISRLYGSAEVGAEAAKN